MLVYNIDKNIFLVNINKFYKIMENVYEKNYY